jgi:hypothetical protein
LLNYLSRYKLPFRHLYCKAWTSRNFNLGIVATSRVESAHKAIKRFLKNRLSNLQELYDTIRSATAAQRKTYDKRSQQQRQKNFAAKHKAVGILRNLQFRISSKPLEKVYEQYRLG